MNNVTRDNVDAENSKKTLTNLVFQQSIPFLAKIHWPHGKPMKKASSTSRSFTHGILQIANVHWEEMKVWVVQDFIDDQDLDTIP